MAILHKFGRNPDIDTAATETIWEAGGLYVWPTTTETIDIVSDDVNDTSAGTGARTVTIEGLDGDYNEVEETVTLNGLTTVTTTNSFFRVNRAYISSVGSGLTNAGNITGQNTTSTQSLLQLSTGLGQSQLALYTTPNNTFLEVDEIFGWPFKGAAGGVEINILIREFGTPFRLKGTIGFHTQSGGSSRRFNNTFFVPPKSDIELQGIVTANNTGVSAAFSGTLRTTRP